MPLNPHLHLVNGCRIPAPTIADAYRRALGWTDADRRRFLCALCLLDTAVPLVRVAPVGEPLVRSHRPRDVWPGAQYTPGPLTCHVHLASLQLHSSDLPPLEGFHSLRVLNLAHNGLTSAIALMTLGSLEELDLHDNSIT